MKRLKSGCPFFHMNSHFHTKLYLYEANRNIIVHDDNDILQETLGKNSIALPTTSGSMRTLQ